MNALDERKKEADVLAQEEKFQFEEKLHKTKLELQTQLQASQIKDSEQPLHATQTPSDGQAKLPKLVITKFDGNFMDWPRFWGQFTKIIDKTSATPITKFPYLRELLEPRVKRTLEALPFNVEGYNCEKSILKEKFGKDSEIIKAYTSEILGLPTISRCES